MYNAKVGESGWAVIASRELTVENTTHCGALCVICPREEYDQEWKHMAFELFKTVVDQAVELGITSLDLGFGGLHQILCDLYSSGLPAQTPPLLQLLFGCTAQLLEPASARIGRVTPV